MEGDPRNPKVSLLKKYDIPIDHLTYEYIEKCTDKKELERIVRILRSGEEGAYPDLLNTAEEKLKKIAPDSRVLRVEVPALTKESLTTEEWKSVESELISWEEEMKVMDKSLDFEKNRMDVVGNKNMPEVRKVAQPSPTPKSAPKKVKEQVSTKNERIKSGDYAAWDKFDVDKELLKMDVDEERKQEEKEKLKREVKKKTKEKKIEIQEVDKECYSSMEQLVLANQAKDRGNECYKAGDLENALKYYNISINFCSTENAYNNRAMTYLKMKEYQKAIDDCNKVLEMSKNNVKALHRRATAYQNMSSDDSNNNNSSNSSKNNNNINNYDELALQDFYKIVLIEPNNKVAQLELQKLKKKLNIESVGKKFRMPILESGDGLSSNTDSKAIEKKSAWNNKDDYTPVDKLPLTYYGPSTSTFQCEPYSMVHRALSGSSFPGQILCKCNSNKTRQNPLCQKCGEAMSTPKPSNRAIIAKPKDETKSNSETKAKIQSQKDQINENKKVDISSDNMPKDKINNVENNSKNLLVKEENVEDLPPTHINDKEKVGDDKLDSEKTSQNKVQILNGLVCKGESSESKIVESPKSNKTLDKVEVDNKLDLKNSVVKCGSEDKEVESSKIECKLNNLKIDSNSNESTKKDVTENSNLNCSSSKSEISNSSHDVNHTSKKSKKKKKKSKEHREINLSEYPKPIKVVHAAKYLHPTSVEPKIKNESPKEPQKQINLSSSCQFKEFVPNNKRSIGDSVSFGSPGGSWITSATKTTTYQGDNAKLEKIMSDLSLEGNKENIMENKSVGVVDRSEKDGIELKKEVVESGFEFMKTWEELKKVDETYTKRAEVIRMIKPNDLGKVIGIKLDSDMLRCLLECLERHFVENDPKVVVEFLKQLPKIPRFGLVSMFLAENDKKILKKLIDTTEGKGFKLDEDTKKVLAS